MNEVVEAAMAWLDESPHLIQRDLGLRVGLTSHGVGKVLNELGLRKDGCPTPEAYERKMVEIDHSGPWPQFKWNERKIVPLLRHVLKLRNIETTES